MEVETDGGKRRKSRNKDEQIREKERGREKGGR